MVYLNKRFCFYRVLMASVWFSRRPSLIYFATMQFNEEVLTMLARGVKYREPVVVEKYNLWIMRSELLHQYLESFVLVQKVVQYARSLVCVIIAQNSLRRDTISAPKQTKANIRLQATMYFTAFVPRRLFHQKDIDRSKADFRPGVVNMQYKIA